MLKGSPDLQCGKPVNLPAASVLCDRSQWPDGGWGSPTPNCGAPGPARGAPAKPGIAFTTPPQYDPQTGVVSVGHIVSTSGRCRYLPWNDDLGFGPFQSYFGTPFNRWLLRCADGTDVQASFGNIWISNRAGYSCQVYGAPYSGQRRIQIPLDWAGTLWVLVWIISGEAGYAASESATARFQITGTQYQC